MSARCQRLEDKNGNAVGETLPLKIERLKSENAELREDKERLDWIDANRPKLDKWNNQFFVGAAFTREGHKDIRAAIDAARNRSDHIGDINEMMQKGKEAQP